MTLPAAPLGPLPTKNNVTGIQQIPVTLTYGFPKTYTHNVGANPLAVQIFTTGGVPVESTKVAITTPTTSTIVLTPAASVSGVDFWVIITWAMPSEFLDGAPAANFT